MRLQRTIVTDVYGLFVRVPLVCVCLSRVMQQIGRSKGEARRRSRIATHVLPYVLICSTERSLSTQYHVIVRRQQLLWFGVPMLRLPGGVQIAPVESRAELKFLMCTVQCSHMYSTVLTYVQYRTLMRAAQCSHLYNTVLSYVQYSTLTCTVQYPHTSRTVLSCAQYGALICTVLHVLHSGPTWGAFLCLPE